MSQDSGAPPSSFHAVAASFAGWTMDAFDYFVVVFLYDTLAKQFGVSKGMIVATTFATLVMRPVGALVFGLLSDRFGRRNLLMANIVFFSVVELICGFSPTYTFFLCMRILYGIGMGGEWGVGAALAMEAVPKRLRGMFSGVLQSGYSMGYILAAVVARVVLPHPVIFGEPSWRWMFWLGGIPALLAFYISRRVPESEAWKQHRAESTGQIARILGAEWKRLVYLVFLMTFMMFLSHGTQDLYPDFLRFRGASAATAADIAILFNIGAIVGAIMFGRFSEKIGRRFSMIAALGLALAVIPLWAFGGSLAILAIGAFLMQAGAQGAWGVIPVYLNEMSPDKTRGLVPGMAYQLGILFAARTNIMEFNLQRTVGYQWALGGFEIVTIVVLAVTLLLGTERRGRAFTKSTAPTETPLTPVEEPAVRS